MKTILIITTWMMSMGPTVVVQPLDSMNACRSGMQAAAEMLRGQALSNLTGPHNRLVLENGQNPDELLLRTPLASKEMARLRCVNVNNPSKISPAP